MPITLESGNTITFEAYKKMKSLPKYMQERIVDFQYFSWAGGWDGARYVVGLSPNDDDEIRDDAYCYEDNLKDLKDAIRMYLDRGMRLGLDY